MARTQVFVSYSHADSDHLLRLKVHLRPYERQSLVDLWSDTRIHTGQQWKKEIETALNRAAVAILLVSADFLASDFVSDNELPPLLAAAETNGVKILPVIVKPCAFTAVQSVAKYQAVNDPEHPLISLSEAERERVWVRLASDVHSALLEFQQRSESKDVADQVPQPLFGELPLGQELIREEIQEPWRIEDYLVYEYEHVDFLEFMPSAAAVLQNVNHAEAILNAVKRRFASAGWDGDGDIQLLWLPPFVGAGVEDTWGLAVWFVKQLNNGTAFLASPVPLPFARLLAQQH